jgi:hypothetical protein
VNIKTSLRVLAALAALAGVLAATTGAAARNGQGSVVLGSTRFYGQPPGNAVGWGTAHPKRIFNGGDPSGMAWRIAWTHWGSSTAMGYGLTWVPTPRGGYYRTPGRIELRASGIGHCTASGPLAYRRLDVRVPSHPGGPLGHWGNWSFTGTICHS